MIKSKTKKIIKYAVAFTSIAAILFSLAVILYIKFNILDIVYVNYDYKITNQSRTLGINAGSDAMHFGILGPGMVGTREITLETNETALVIIKDIGLGTVFPDKNRFILEANTNVSVNFKAKQKPDTEPGNYSGKVRIIFKKV